MQESFENIALSLAETGLFVGPSIFSESLTRRLLARAEALRSSGALRPARVGRASRASAAPELRRDHTCWLEATSSDAAEQEAINQVDALRIALNRSLFLGARTAELHFAHYAPGAFYKTHVDRFGDHGARLLSLVFYLSRDWRASDGGELVLYDDPASARVRRRVLPAAGIMVAFRSEQFPHEVCAAARDRYSLTGWLRHD